MEHLLSDSAIQGELAAFKATADLLASQKLALPNSYCPPLNQRHKRATLVQVPVCAPPSTAADDDTAGPSNDPAANANRDVYHLTVKSLKPAFALELEASPTATIRDLKLRLADEYPDRAPGPDAQRWILKGKAMGDNKLLKEFAAVVAAHAADPNTPTVINLMVNKSAAAAAAADPVDAPAASAPSPKSPSKSGGIPELTLSEPDPVTGHARRSSVSLRADLDRTSASRDEANSSSSLAGESEQFLADVTAPDLWIDVRRVCEEKFSRNGGEAQKVWEAMFGGARDWISPSQKALIREQVGYSAMGGC